jgi:ABC-2 type transport system ATP-binding protein
MRKADEEEAVISVTEARPCPRSGLAVEAEGLEKRFGSTRGLAGVDLQVPPGTVYGLLGPNGAGKTTTVRILATLLAPDSGRARVAGHDVAAVPHLVRQVIALAGQSATVDEDLTGRENLVFLARLAGLRRAGAKARAADLLAAFGLQEAASRQAKTYSGGMRRRLDLAASLITRAAVYFLDEPTTGLDPASRAQVHELIRALAAGGATVLLTTQYLDEADRLCARIAVIDHGAVIAEGTPGQLKAAAGAGTLRVRLADPAQRPQARHALARLLGAPVRDDSDPALLTATIGAAQGRSPSDQAAAAVAELGRAGITIGEFALGQPSLDEVFITLTSQSAAVATPPPAGAETPAATR